MFSQSLYESLTAHLATDCVEDRLVQVDGVRTETVQEPPPSWRDPRVGRAARFGPEATARRTTTTGSHSPGGRDGEARAKVDAEKGGEATAVRVRSGLPKRRDAVVVP